MPLLEINFDGIVGPSHNYAGLSPGNLAATMNAGDLSFPRAAALQGLDKMLSNMALGLAQGFFVPPPRPNTHWLDQLAADPTLDRALLAGAWSASAMWTANAATVSPAPDTRDGRCHLTVANLVTMPHRSHEWPDTLRQLRLAFADQRHFAVHGPVPPCFGDEGAANHMRLAEAHGAPGVEIFVYGKVSGRFPARQNEQAGHVIARRHGLDPARVLFIEQSAEAIAAGAFHNDVVAVANETVVLAHECAFADPEQAWRAMAEACPAVQIVVVPERAVSLDEAIRSYLFNAQLVTMPEGGQALIVPNEAWDSLPVRQFLDGLVASNGPIRQVRAVNVRQSMANGGGPACLRLRVVADPVTVDPRFLLDEAKGDAIRAVVERHWPEQIDPADLGSAALASTVTAAREALLDALDLSELA
ncbi:MAG TPA: N-succinylarginine dihydrolase [Croceibacterium sp.]|nr:N-succinylarginine dihydrolase [Croceibacterium sp.]